jgi:arylsulfatase A-like enzyme
MTPNLWALRNEGVWFANHHCTYPTSTEVNGAVLACGVLPQRNNIVGNHEYRPEIDPLTGIDTESIKSVRRGDELTDGHYVGVPTIAELVQRQGKNTSVAGAKPVALLHDRLPRAKDSKNRVWFVAGALPGSISELCTARLGPFPAPASPNTARDTWATRCLVETFWEPDVSYYSVLWLSEPDYSQHRHGVGSQQAIEAIRQCDRRLGLVLSQLELRGVRDQTDIVVVSDHGFSTIARQTDLAATLRSAGMNARVEWEKPPQTNDVVVVPNGGTVMFYVIGKDPKVIRNLVRTLHSEAFAGVILTRDALPGTVSLKEVGMAAETAPDVVLAMRWKKVPSESEHPRSDMSTEGTKYPIGGGMHVTLGPTDLRNFAVANGPDFLRGVDDPLPSGNIDVVPTFLWLMGIEPPEPSDGRVLSEALRASGPKLREIKLGRLSAVPIWREGCGNNISGSPSSTECATSMKETDNGRPIKDRPVSLAILPPVFAGDATLLECRRSRNARRAKSAVDRPCASHGLHLKPGQPGNGGQPSIGCTD